MQVFNFDNFLDRIGVPYIPNIGDTINHLTPLVSNGTYLAGGSVLALLENVQDYAGDYDLWFASDDDYLHTLGNIEADGGSSIAQTNNAATFKYKNKTIQLIHRAYFPTVQHLLDDFDITVCMAAVDFQEKPNLYLGDYTLLDINRKEIHLHNVRQAASTLKRLVKYASRGYHVPTDSYIALVKEMEGKENAVINDLNTLSNGETYD